jgi:NTE family protein
MPTEIHAPTELIAPDLVERRQPDKGIAIALSGGGYRAMLFHVGALWRLQDLGLLNCTASAPHASDFGPLRRISSVSGGSITSAQLALRWSACRTDDPSALTRHAAFEQNVVTPIRRFSEVNLASFNASGVLAILSAVVLPGSVNEHVAKAYHKHLFGDATLQDLPNEPRFVINASNLQSGAVWRFMKPYIRDWRVGEIRNTRLVTVAQAVAASSAFPPPLSPAVFKFKESDYTPNSGGPGSDNLQRPPFTTRVVLSDGGVYDNLGLETAWKHYKTLLVSNAGKPFEFEEKPGTNWVSQSARVIGVMDNQVRSLRVRQLIDSFNPGPTGSLPLRTGCYWGIDSNIANFQAPNTLPCPQARTRELAGVTTDLARKSSELQERLINWGYAICDASVRSHVDSTLAQPAGFPYARGV